MILKLQQKKETYKCNDKSRAQHFREKGKVITQLIRKKVDSGYPEVPTKKKVPQKKS